MKRRKYAAVKAAIVLTFATVTLAFQSTVLSYLSTSLGRQPQFSSDFRVTAVHDRGVRRAPRHGVVMMARASSLRTDQMRRAKNAAPVIMSGKEKKKAKHDRRMRNREKFASSGRRLIKLNQEDESSFYIGFVGMNRAGRAQALRSVESFLKKATELKIAKFHQGAADIKLVDAGNVGLSDMAGQDERKLSLVRRCDLLVHVVRCFDLYAPKPTQESAESEDIGNDQRGKNSFQSGQKDEKEVKEIDWPLSPTPLEDVKSVRADMAYADLQFIEERHKSNHTKWHWRDKRRALNERTALALVTPVLEDSYAMGGQLKPVGLGFRESCLRDEPRGNGTMIYRSRLRTAVREIGFLSPKPNVYVANIPPEAAPQDDSDKDEGVTEYQASNPNRETSDTNQEASDAEKEAAESAAAIAKVALAHAAKIVRLRLKFKGVRAIAACLQFEDGQERLGVEVYKAIPRSVLSLDPKIKKAVKSAAKKARY